MSEMRFVLITGVKGGFPRVISSFRKFCGKGYDDCFWLIFLSDFGCSIVSGGWVDYYPSYLMSVMFGKTIGLKGSSIYCVAS